jgi:Mg2+ and Co2+ transporter CorA
MAWIGMFRPNEAQLLPLADEFGLHEVAIEDAIVAHQRPKLEQYDDTSSPVSALRPASMTSRRSSSVRSTASPGPTSS